LVLSTLSAPPSILSPEHEQDPHITCPVLRDGFPVHYDVWPVSRMDDVRTVFESTGVRNDHDTSPFRVIFGRTIIEMDGREHAAHRRLVELGIAINVLLDTMGGVPWFAAGFLSAESGVWFRAARRVELTSTRQA
jgi:pulcherriminic acid synthase